MLLHQVLVLSTQQVRLVLLRMLRPLLSSSLQL
jgi:hypothetical protein